MLALKQQTSPLISCVRAGPDSTRQYLECSGYFPKVFPAIDVQPVGFAPPRVTSQESVRIWNVVMMKCPHKCKVGSFDTREDRCLICLNTPTRRLHQQPVEQLLTRKQTEKRQLQLLHFCFSSPAFAFLSFPILPPPDPAQGAASPCNLTTSGKE